MWELGGAYECRGALSSRARHEARRAALVRGSQDASFSLSSGAFPACAGGGSTVLQPARVPRHLSSVQFDAQGALLACAVSSGGVQVLDFAELRTQLHFRAPGAGISSVTPILRLENERQADAVRWSHTSQDLLATVSAADADVHLFDLGICDDAPTEVLLGDGQSVRVPGAPLRSTTGGLADVAPFHADSRKVLAAGHAGKVLLWDTRSGLRPRAVLSAPRSSGPLMSLALTDDDQTIFVGSECGDIYSWDLRGGRQTSAFLAPNQVTYSLLHTLSVAALLLDVPALAEEVDVQPSAVHALAVDPHDRRRLAFQLACGWSGVLDITALSVTHVHCPPPPWLLTTEPQTAAQHALWAIKHRPAWGRDGMFMTGTRAASAVHVLDFGATPRAACHVARSACAPECVDDQPCRSCQRPLTLRTTAPVTVTAVHPLHDAIVAGTQGGNLDVAAMPAFCADHAETAP